MQTTTNTLFPEFVVIIPERYMPKRPGDKPQECGVKYEVVKTGHHTFITLKTLTFSPACLNYLTWGPMLFGEILEAAKAHYGKTASDPFWDAEKELTNAETK